MAKKRIKSKMTSHGKKRVKERLSENIRAGLDLVNAARKKGLRWNDLDRYKEKEIIQVDSLPGWGYDDQGRPRINHITWGAINKYLKSRKNISTRIYYQDFVYVYFKTSHRLITCYPANKTIHKALAFLQEFKQ